MWQEHLKKLATHLVNLHKLDIVNRQKVLIKCRQSLEQMENALSGEATVQVEANLEGSQQKLPKTHPLKQQGQ